MCIRDREMRGRWTAMLIKHVRSWIERKHKEICFYLTQLLCGHGYLHDIGKILFVDSPDVVDNAEHPLLPKIGKLLQIFLHPLVADTNMIDQVTSSVPC